MSERAWYAFLQVRAKAILAAGFFRVGTVLLRRMYVLSATGHHTRRVHLAGITAPIATLSDRAQGIELVCFDGVCTCLG